MTSPIPSGQPKPTQVHHGHHRHKKPDAGQPNPTGWGQNPIPLS
jgi:hypothetical protein